MKRRTVYVIGFGIAMSLGAGLAIGGLVIADVFSATPGGQQQSVETSTPQVPVQTSEPTPTSKSVPSATSTPTEPSPSIDVGAIRGIERNRNQISADVELDGASKVVFTHDSEIIGAFTESHHKVFHELNDEPIVEQGEVVRVYAYWNGERHQIAQKTIVGV